MLVGFCAFTRNSVTCVMSFGRDTPRISNTWEDSSTDQGTAHGPFGHEHHELPALVAHGLPGYEQDEQGGFPCLYKHSHFP